MISAGSGLFASDLLELDPAVELHRGSGRVVHDASFYLYLERVTDNLQNIAQGNVAVTTVLNAINTARAQPMTAYRVITSL